MITEIVFFKLQPGIDVATLKARCESTASKRAQSPGFAACRSDQSIAGIHAAVAASLARNAGNFAPSSATV